MTHVLKFVHVQRHVVAVAVSCCCGCIVMRLPVGPFKGWGGGVSCPTNKGP